MQASLKDHSFLVCLAGIVDAVQPSLPPAPQLTAPQASEPKSSLPGQGGEVPAQANAAVQEVQKGADQAVEAAPGWDLSALLIRTCKPRFCAI